MCTQCRNYLDNFITTEIKGECDELFQWLYDPNHTHTPSASSSDSRGVLSQSFNQLVMKGKQDSLKDFLEGNL